MLATDPGARGLRDDAAVLAMQGDLVLTHDMLVEGVHFLPTDPPADVAWKLVAVNLSDLAAKGATPRGVLLGYGLSDPDWDAAFAEGLGAALSAMAVSLLGGDTVTAPRKTRILSLTAVGDAPAWGAPSRDGAQAGDRLWVSGTIGDAGPGLEIARGRRDGPPALLSRYRRPVPRTDMGIAVSRRVTAMMDVSDGLLIDAKRLALASGVAATIDLDAVPLSIDYRQSVGNDRAERLVAATAGDDYELLFTALPDAEADLLACSAAHRVTLTMIGTIGSGSGICLRDAAGEVPLPVRLGWEHELA